MYAMGTISPPLPCVQDRNPTLHQVWFVDDFLVTSDIAKLDQWLDGPHRFGPAFEKYCANPMKCWLIVKPKHNDIALEVFDSAGVHVSTEGRPDPAQCRSQD